MASNDLLRVFEWPKALSVLNEVLGITTIVVWASLVVVSIAGLATGRSLRD